MHSRTHTTAPSATTHDPLAAVVRGIWLPTMALVATTLGCAIGEPVVEESTEAELQTSGASSVEGGGEWGDDAGGDGSRPPQHGPCDEGLEGCPCWFDEECAPGMLCVEDSCVPDGNTCGDGVVGTDEECDHGDANADDAWCKSDCTMQFCGDGVVGPEEACDDGNDDEDACTSDCILPGCGNGAIEPGEECDDGNTEDGDGCTSTCACLLTFEHEISVDGWQTDGGWGLYTEAPESHEEPAVPFETAGTVFGTDGNRVAPYPSGEWEASLATTTPFTIPETLHFRSWHVDEGGMLLFDGTAVDQKRIRISVDDGLNWETLVDCADETLASDMPFCQVEDGPRDESDWDYIELDLSAFAGAQGRLRFEYDTSDSCCEYEQGWFIDDINALDCP